MESLGDDSGEGVTEEERPSLSFAINGSAIEICLPESNAKAP